MTLGPPPLASRRFAAAVSFQEVSGMYESADPRLALLDALQYVPLPSLKDVPPTAVTSGMLAGRVTAVPWTAVAAVLDSQPKAPESQQRGGGLGSRFARSVTQTDHRRKVLRDRVLHRVENVARVNVGQAGVLGYRAGPFHVEVRFHHIAAHDAGVFGSGDQHDLRIVLGQIEHRAEGLDVRKVDGRLAGDHQSLAGAVIAILVQALEVVDGRRIVRSQVM